MQKKFLKWIAGGALYCVALTPDFAFGIQWTCVTLLNDGNFIRATEDEREDGFWYPRLVELDAAIDFQHLPPELQNLADLEKLLAASPSFHLAVRNFIASLDESEILTEETPSPFLANHLSKILFNGGLPRLKAAEKIAELVRGKSAKSLEGELQRRWNDTSEEVVYEWIIADENTVTKEQIWGRPLAEDEQTGIVAIESTPDRIARLIRMRRVTPIVRPGEILRDSFRFTLDKFVEDHLDPLQESFENLFGLKDQGAFDKVDELLEPFAKAQGKTDPEALMAESSEVYARIMGSKLYFDEFLKFKDRYLEAGQKIMELYGDPKLTTAERRKLSELAQDRLISFSVDLLATGLNVKQPHEYRYREHLLRIQWMNGDLIRNVIPVGTILNLGGPDSGGSGLIIP